MIIRTCIALVLLLWTRVAAGFLWSKSGGLGSCLNALSSPQLKQAIGSSNAASIRSDEQVRSTAQRIDVAIAKSGGGLFLRNPALNQTLRVVRHDQEGTVHVDVLGNNSNPEVTYESSYERIFGIYKLPVGHCIAMVKSSEPMSSFISGSYLVRKVTEITFVAIPPSSKDTTECGIDDEQLKEKQKTAIALMQETFSRHSFYFSTSEVYDVTRNLQSNLDYQYITKKRAFTAPPLWQTCDERFFWNLNVVSDLIDVPELHGGWITPMMNAWVSSETIYVNKQTLTLTLISRRSRRRQGPRYIKRGSDGLGDVANFVETEQILQRMSDNRTFSFVQIRGSIPIFWSQPETWKLKPSILPLSDLALHGRALKTHLLDLAKYYVRRFSSSPMTNDESVKAFGNSTGQPDIILINLIDKSGTQGQLGKWLIAAFQTVQRGVINIFSTPEEAPTTQSVKKEAGMPSSSFTSTTVSVPSSALIVANSEGELPYRIERDETLQNRKIMTQTDFKCPLSDYDIHRMTTFETRDRDDDTLTKIKQQMEEIGNGLNTKTAPNLSKKPHLMVRFLWFDYHKKCKGGNVKALQELHPAVTATLRRDGGGYCEIVPPNHPTPSSLIVAGNGAETNTENSVKSGEAILVQTQRSIIRTNCVDCLDRTNVVQTLLARWALIAQLKDLNLLSLGRSGRPLFAEVSDKSSPSNEDVDSAIVLPDMNVEHIFRTMWGDNGDHMSMMYAGTKALKRDVTRFGRRTNQGAIDDGVNSAMRYFINNYQDPVRQRGIDRILGLIEGDDIRRPVRSLPEIARLMEEDDDEESDRDKEGEEEEEEEEEEDSDDDIEERESRGADVTAGTAATDTHSPSLTSTASSPSSPSSSAVTNTTQIPSQSSNQSGPETEPIDMEEISRNYREKIDTILEELKQLQRDHLLASVATADAAVAGTLILDTPSENKIKPKKSNQLIITRTTKPTRASDRTVTKLGATSSPLRATLRALGKSKVIVFVICLLMILRFHSAMLLGGMK